jgi:hypothetical protein
MALTKHTVDLYNTTIVEIVRDRRARKTLESLYIQKYKEVIFNLEKVCIVPQFTANYVFRGIK